MKTIKKFNLKRIISFLLVFTLIFSQNSMMVFADILKTKSTVNVSNNLDNQNNSEKNNLGLTTRDSSSKPIEPNSSGNFIEPEKIQAGSYTITENGIYPFTGSWGTKSTLDLQKSNDDERGISTYDNTKKGYYYKQLDTYKQIAYGLYFTVLKVLEKDEYYDTSGYDLYPSDFYGVLTAVIHENPELFWGYNMDVEVDNTGKVTKIKYETPFTQSELDTMKFELKKSREEALNSIRSKLGQNPTRFKVAKEVHDYLVSNNHYGSEVCPEQTHGNQEAHLGCKGMIIEHTAYGALVKDDKYGLVCEGFASGFVLLCKDLNVEALYDAGFNDGVNSLHAWNYVKMDDDEWYVVDLTYDNGVYQKNGIVYDLFLAGIDNPNLGFKHDSYMGSYLNHKYKGQEYSIPIISKDSYINFEVIYPNTSKLPRNVFFKFSDILNDFKDKNLQGNHTIILKNNYTLSEEEVEELKNYNVTSQQKFCIKADFKKKDNRCTLNSRTNEICFPISVYLYDIAYNIASTYVGGSSIVVGQNVSNGENECSIYLFEKEDSTKSNTVYITSGNWKNVVSAYPSTQNSVQNIHNGNISINIQSANVENMILSQGSTVRGNIDFNISKNGNVDNFVYGNDLSLNEGKNLNINISDATVGKFKQNSSPIRANTVINIKSGIIKNLIGPYTFDTSNICKTTINIKDDLTVNSLSNFDNLVIENGKTLNVTNELNYNKTNCHREGLVTFNGNSTLKLPKIISNIGSLNSFGESNKLVLSKENSYLSVNERQGYQGTKITISYDKGLVPKNRDELIRYKNVTLADIPLNNFENGISKRYQLDYDESTGSIILFSSNCPIKVEDKEKNVYKCSSLYEGIKYIEKKSDKKFKEVKFYIDENYEMSREDLEKLKSYSSTLLNQKFVFISENQDTVLSTSDNLIFPFTDEVLEIEFKDITLDFENKNIFASGNNLTMDDTVKMTSRSNVDIYGGSYGEKVTNSRLILDGGNFNNVYGGGSSSNGTVKNNVNISLDKLVSVKGSVYGGAEDDKTGTSKLQGMTTINLLGGTVSGSIIGGGKNEQSQVFNKIVINYSGTKVNNIYGFKKSLSPGSESKNITININKNANLNVVAGFNELNIRSGVKLNIAYILKYDAGISSNSEGKVTLDFGSDLCIPNTTIDQYREVGKLEILGDSNLHIYKDKYLLINGNTKPVSGKKIKISYYNETPDLDDKLVKFSNNSLASNENFTTDYHFDISADTQTGFLYLSKKTYKINLYKEQGVLDRTDVVYENGEYTFKEPTKIKNKKFIRWKDLDDGSYYRVGEKINVKRDMSLEAEYENVQEYEITLKVNEMYYKTEYVEAGKSYTLEPAPPIPEKYFIGWEDESGPSNNTYSLSSSMIKSVNYMQPGTSIIVNRDLTFDAEYRNEVKYDIDYNNGNEDATVHEVYYDGGTMTVPSAPPKGITIPFGKIFGGFRVIFNGVGNIVGGIFNSIFRPGQSITIKPGIHIEADWVDELHVNLYDEDGDVDKTDKVGKGLEYIIPEAPVKEYKQLLYWKNAANPNDIYMENEKITVDTNLDLKPVYKNNKIISLRLDSKEPKYFANLNLALDYLENRSAKVVTFELLEDYALTDPDMEKLRDFNRSDMNFIIKGCNNNIKLRVEKSIKLPTDTTFENIVLNYVSNNNQAIYARGHKLEMGDNIKMEGIGAPILIGGDDETDVGQSNIIVRSGTYKDIYGGGYSEYSVVNGDTTIELLGGVVLGDIYGGSQSTDLNNNLIKRGTTTIKLSGGEVGGVVSGTSKFLGYGNSNDVNIQLLGTKLKKGEVYGGYLDPEPVSHNTGTTTITVEKDYDLNNLLGFTKLDIKKDIRLEVKNALSHIGGIQLKDTNGEICLNGNSTLIVPSTEYEEYRQAGWINSQGSNNKIIVNKNQYLSLTSTREDVIDTNRVILDFKNKDTSKDISVLLKYTNNKGKARAKRFSKGSNIQSELILKGDKEKGVIYSDERNLIRIIDPKEKTRGFKTIKDAIESIKSDSPKGEYKINLLENYTLKDTDITALKDLNISDVKFVITGLLNENTKSKAELSVSNSIMLSTDTKFENIVFNYGESTGHGIYARGHKLEMGKNITMEGTGAPMLLGGDNKKDVNKSEIIVESGTYSNIYGGGYLEDSGVQGNITIKLLDGDVRGDIYAGSQDTGLISRGKTNIILSGGTVGGVVSGTSKHLVLENNNDVNIDLKGTELKNGEVYGGYPQDREESHNAGEATINVSKDYTLNKLLGFTKLNIEQNVRLEVKKVLNHKGGINATDNSGEVCLNGNNTLIVPASHDSSERQIGYLNAKGENNRIFVYKDMYLSLTSEKQDTIENQIELGFKDILDGAYIDALTRESILLKYENNKEKAKNNCNKFKRGIYLPDDTVIKHNEKDGSIYIIENDM